MLKASFFTVVVTLLLRHAHAQTAPPAPPMETVTLDQAVERAIKNNPTVAQAAQDILRAEGLLQQARAATMPFITAGMSTLVNSTERRFDDVVTSPQTQATLSAQFGMPVLGAVQMGRQGAGAGSVRDREIFSPRTREPGSPSPRRRHTSPSSR